MASDGGAVWLAMTCGDPLTTLLSLMTHWPVPEKPEAGYSGAVR